MEGGGQVQAIAMFLAGDMSRGGLNARAAANIHEASQWGDAAAAMVYLYTFIFGATWFTVPWLYLAEIFPLLVRAKGNAWGVFHSAPVSKLTIRRRSLTLALPYIFKAIGSEDVVRLRSVQHH